MLLIAYTDFSGGQFYLTLLMSLYNLDYYLSRYLNKCGSMYHGNFANTSHM